jgi:DNA invertase Pin-like site-specific DNA recombinase
MLRSRSRRENPSAEVRAGFFGEAQAERSEGLSAMTQNIGKNSQIRRGRPRKIVDEGRIVELASKGHTLEEIGAFCGISVDTLERSFAEPIKRGRALRNGSLRAKQFEVAMSGNTSMLIWLGKVMLGQSETGPRQGSEV